MRKSIAGNNKFSCLIIFPDQRYSLEHILEALARQNQQMSLEQSNDIGDIQ